MLQSILKDYTLILRSKEVEMTSSNTEKLVQDGTRPRPSTST